MQERHLPDIRYPSVYEQQALEGILSWRVPENDWITRTSNSLQATLDSATEHLRRIPGVDWTIDNVVTGLVKVTNEIAQDMVWRDAIFESFRDSGHNHVSTLDHIAFLDLAHIDYELDGLATKYKSIAMRKIEKGNVI